MQNLGIIVGEKVSLRPITYDDTDLIISWRNNPIIQQNFIFRKPFTKEMHIKWLDTKVKSGFVVQYIIEDKGTKEPLGSVYFRDINKEFHSAEYGIFIGEISAHKKGIGSEAAKLFTEFGFKKLNLHRIELRVFERNNIAIKSYENAGFQIEGVFRDMVYFDGKYENIVFMAKLNPYSGSSQSYILDGEEYRQDGNSQR